MDRRRCLAALAAGVPAFAGCAGLAGRPDAGRTSPTAAAARGEGNTTGTSANQGEVSLPIPKNDLQRGAAKDGIPAIVDPRFGTDWSDFSTTASNREGVEYRSNPTLDSEERVVGVERGGRARAYPLAVLNWHEIVNDDFGGPLLVTYCPLCGSGLTAERRVDGEETTFGVSGYLWNADLVMYDRATDSLWSQIMATAIRGPKTGRTLSLVPSTLTTWGAWTDSHPDTEVLLPPPVSGTIGGPTSRDYESNPYVGYDESRRIGIGGESYAGERHPKTEVIGISTGTAARAYPFDAVRGAGVVNDRVGDLPVVVTVAPGASLVAYERRVDGEIPEFGPAGDGHLRAGGSRWERTTGRAVDGPHEGTRLERANDASPMFLFAWRDFHPDTDVYGA